MFTFWSSDDTISREERTNGLEVSRSRKREDFETGTLAVGELVLKCRDGRGLISQWHYSAARALIEVHMYKTSMHSLQTECMRTDFLT